MLSAGCSDWEPIDPPKPVPAERGFFMYDNIGSPFAGNVAAAGRAVAAGALDPGERVIVYHRMSSGNVIYELVRSTSLREGFEKMERKKYAPGENSSLDAATMARVVGDVRALFPEDPDWGFAFGSHGLGWIPKTNTVPISRRRDASGGVSHHPFDVLWAERENPRTRFFASDRGHKLDVSEFIDALDGEEGDRWEWDFIVLDDCFMASVETLYDMRSLADYIIATPTEILIEGFPYDRVVVEVFGDWNEKGFIGVGEEYIDYYGGLSDDYACATVAVVKMAEMEDLAEAVEGLNLRSGELDPEAQKIQYLERLSNPGHVFYDLDDYLGAVKKETMPAEYNAFRAQLDRTVVYAGHTGKFYSDFGGGGYVSVEHFSGLAVFIPWSRTASLFEMYRQTEWYKDVYSE